MPSEKEAWKRLVDAGLLPASELFSPSKAQDAYYSGLLKCNQKEHGATGRELAGLGDPVQSRTLEDKLVELERLAENQLDKPFTRRLIALRMAAKALGLPAGDRDLQRLLSEAQRRRDGFAPLVGYRALDRAPTPWLVEGLILRGRLNLLVGAPKLGKTSLVLSLISRWSRGERAFLDLPLVGVCPQVLILGPDQPESDWAAMLHAEGLLDQRGHFVLPIIDLATAGNGWALDEEGIMLATDFARKHPGILIVIDSLRAAVRPLGFEESEAQADEPLRALIAALDGLDATVLMIHHSGKAPKSSPTLASRGSSAIPAAASQVIGLQRLDAEFGSRERRIVLSTEGRGGMPIELLIERSPDWGWIAHGDATAVAAEKRLRTAEEKLNDRQAAVLLRVRSRAVEGLVTVVEDIQDLISGADCLRAARSTLDQLAQKGLVLAEVQVTPNGRQKLYRARPLTSRTTPCTPGYSLPSFPSSPPESNPQSIAENASGERVRREKIDGMFLSLGAEVQGECAADLCPLSETPSSTGGRVHVLNSDEGWISTNSGWRCQALALRAERPSLAPYSVALKLEQYGFPGITGKEVAELFQALPGP